MLVKTQPKIKISIISQHPIQYPTSSHNAISNTGAIRKFVIPNTPFMNKKRIITPLHGQLSNVTVLK